MRSRRTDPSHTRRTRVAHLRPGFIPRGDALATHDTTTQQLIDWMFSPTEPPAKTRHSVNAETVTLADLEPTINAQSPTPTIIPVREFVSIRTSNAARRWIPWSIVVAGGGVAAVRLAVVLTESTHSVLAAVATGAVVLCGLLLIAAQAIEATRR